MSKHLKLDIVSDVSCPWCIIGYQSLNQALIKLAADISVDITWQPFELNPDMPKEGQDITEHLTEKYGISIEQGEQNRLMIKQRGLALGYEFGNRGGGQIYNTFDAHRLLHWAKEYDKQTELKLALFDLYFKDSGDPSDHQKLLAVSQNVGLDREKAQHILASNEYEEEVRALQRHYQAMGISSVPAVIVNDKHLISGGQPPDVFEQALREIAKES
ncbi:DsbA family oxidoreductase [Colwellia hornerae]|uniref:DsbA family oxidoreductase n=1 Tax=Colwellia hornerae TaxID=89402 RepID=A0A5C6QRC3_9GAMM|nr:DsbA family oxidoreductase [Colwellia hornerae]TWX57707.1 DsbA family oxidoreductase [Colwellia hornerae]TWX62562.1 DsbA family oxidoreductase [Colwellia hornerae]TWX71474.1 DsbA family oxidoreductase [Colwellia hornerae]